MMPPDIADRMKRALDKLSTNPRAACSIAFGWYLRGAVDTTRVKVLVEKHAVRVDGGCYEAAR